jgi:hypothetical protein
LWFIIGNSEFYDDIADKKVSCWACLLLLLYVILLVSLTGYSKRTSESQRTKNGRNKYECSSRRRFRHFQGQKCTGIVHHRSAWHGRNLTMASIFRKKKPKLFDSGPEAFDLLMKEAVVREFLDEQESNVCRLRLY